MINLAAIDSFFLTRFLFGVVVYWLIGFFTKGIFEKIQAHYGGLLFKFSNNKIQELKRYANSTCTDIDDVLVNPTAGAFDRLDRIVNRHDLSPTEQQLYRQLLDESYRISLLLEKLGVSSD